MKQIYFLLFSLISFNLSFGQTSVFINEIHYDNASSDVDEGFEIAGPAGTDLSSYTLTKYNGSGGASYGEVALSGTIPDLSNGYGVVWFGLPANGFQNGAPDGLALSSGGVLIQFLTYEGQITATDGVALNTTSTDIGVQETSSTPLGHSLQLSGSGTTYEDFTWSDPSANTNGNVNTGQSFGIVVDPTITVGSDVTGLDYFEGSGPSSEGSFSVEGINLTEDLTVSAPTNFEVSLASQGTFASSVTVSQSSGTASGIVYVRLASGLTPDSYTGNATITSSGADSKTVGLSGTVTAADPQITVTAFLNDPFDYVVSAGGPSAEDTFSVEGLFLDADISVTAPANFEVSLTTAEGFAGSVTISPDQSGTVASTTVYVRLAAGLTAGNYTGNITVSSSGVTDELIAVEGNAYGPPTNSLIITGIFDGPLAGGTPKGVELYVINDIQDLSLYGVSSITNGAGTSAGNVEYNFPADAVTAGTYIYLSSASDDTNFQAFFGFGSTYQNGVLGVNGDDSIELYENGQIIDTFGDVDTDGTGEAWDYLDGWAYRNSATGPEGTTFTPTNWTYSGANALDGELSNPTAQSPFPTGTYSETASIIKFDNAEVSVYPNPVHSNLNFIGLSEAVQASVYDMTGRLYFKKEVTNTLDVSSLKAGIYMVKIQNESGSKVFNILKN